MFKVVVLVVTFTFISNLHAEHLCIGAGNTPSSDPFYADKIQSLVQESRQLEADIRKNEERLVFVDQQLEALRNRIPIFYNKFKGHKDLATHATFRVNFEEVKQFNQKHELQLADKKIADSRSKMAFEAEQKRIEGLRISAFETYNENKRNHSAPMRAETEKFKREFLEIDEETKQVEDYFRDERRKLQERWRDRLDPPLFGKVYSPKELEEQKRQLDLEEQKKLIPSRKKREAYVQAFRKKIAEYDAKNSQIDASFVKAMEDIDRIEQKNKDNYANNLEKNQNVYDSKVDVDNAIFDSKMNSVKTALLNDPNPKIQAIAKSDRILNSLDRAHSRINDLADERNNLPEIIEKLKRQRSKYTFINKWWEEQGQFVNNTEAQACLDCEKAPKKQNLFRVPNLKLSCVETSIQKKAASNYEIKCNDTNSRNGVGSNLCVTKQMANYTQWALNKALNCLSTPTDPIDPQAVYRKLNNESTFKFFYAYDGGQGLMQTIGFAQNEMIGMSPHGRSSGRKYMADLMNKNKDNCADYAGIIDFEKEARMDELNKKKGRKPSENRELGKLRAAYPKYNQRLFNQGVSNSCQFISLQDGIHRNIINGLGLYHYYRNEAQNNLTNELFRGTNIAKNPNFKKIRDALTLVYYGPSGPNGGKAIVQARAVPEMRARFKDLSRMPLAEFQKILERHVPYIKAIQRSENAVNNQIPEDELQCVQK